METAQKALTKPAAKKPRLPYIDFMKGMCIILIVGVHVNDQLFPEQVNNMLQAFRVPLYYFLSGLFFKTYDGFGDFARRKTNNIIVPFFFFYLAACALAFVMTDILHLDRQGLISDPFRWQYIFDPFTERDFHYSVALWFLLSLFEVNIIWYLICFMRKAWMRMTAVFILSVVGWVLAYQGIILPMMLDTALNGIPFFMLGTWMKSSGALRPNKRDKWGVIPFLITLVILWFMARPLNIFDGVLPPYPLYYGLSFMAILSFFWFAKSLPKIPIITYIGEFSLIILGTHSFLLTPIRAIIYRSVGESYAASWLVLGVLLAAELAVIPLMKRFFPHFCAQKELIRKRTD